MASTDSFEELEQKIRSQVEDALNEVRQEFLHRLDSTSERISGLVDGELAAAREQVASAVTAEAEEAQAAAIAQALEAKEAEFAEMLASRDNHITELEEARAALQAETEEVRQTLTRDAEEARAAAVAEALENKEAELAEQLAAKEAAISELEEARAALQAQAEETRATLQAEAEETRAALQAEAEASREEAVAAALAEAETRTADAVETALGELCQAVAGIDAARSQTGVLEALLAGTSRFASRSLLFLTREDGLQGWAAQGFEMGEEDLQGIHLDYAEGSAWAELAEGRGTVALDEEACAALCESVDGSQALEGTLIPLVLRDRLAATLYADRQGPEDSLQPLSLQLLVYIAAQALETLPLRRRPATATLRFVTEVPLDEAGLELWQYLAPAEAEEEPVAASAETAEQPIPEPIEGEETTAEEAWQEPEPSEIPQPGPPAYTAAEETGFAIEEVEPEPVPVEPPAPPEPAPEPTPVTTRVSPSMGAGAEVAPPEDVDGPGWAFTTRHFDGEGGSVDAVHEEARRLARLLVTEIKLYNEEQVEEGRRGRNIYRALKEDIDRSRQIYEERVDESVRAETDYFKDELVKILAAGDAEMMGM